MRKKILLLQNKIVLGNKEKNFKKVEDILKSAPKADFIFLPELWASGWDIDNFKQIAQEEKNDVLNFLTDIAQKYRANIFGGSFLRIDNNGLIKNSCPIINKNGELIDFYDKIHLFDNEKNVVSKGTKLVCPEIDGIKFGISICYDIRFPELFRAYMKEFRPDVLVNMSIWPQIRGEQYTILAKARAVENQCTFIGLSSCGEVSNGYYAFGNSLVVESNGKIKSSLDNREGILSCEIDTEKNTKDFIDVLSDMQNITFQIKE